MKPFQHTFQVDILWVNLSSETDDQTNVVAGNNLTPLFQNLKPSTVSKNSPENKVAHSKNDGF